MFPITSRISHLQRIFCSCAGCHRRLIQIHLIAIIKEIDLCIHCTGLFFMYVHKGIGRFLSLLSESNLYLRGKTHTYRISLMRATYEQFFYMTLFLVILMDWRLSVEVAYNPIHIPLFRKRRRIWLSPISQVSVCRSTPDNE